MKIAFYGNYFVRGNLNAYFSRHCVNGRWGDNLGVVDDDPDLMVIVNHPPAMQLPLPFSRSVVVQMEPQSSLSLFPSPFDRPEAHGSSFRYVHDTRRHYNTIEWHISPCYADLVGQSVSLTKNKVLSAIVADSYFLEGHKKRCQFIDFLAERTPLDLYGRNPGWWTKPKTRQCHQGELPPREKDAGLLPYKYHLCAENTSERNYLTEKIVDALLAECLPLYWGCPNLDAFLHPESYVRLDLDSFEASWKRIQLAIENDEWSQRLPYIRASKTRILEELQIFPMLSRVIEFLEYKRESVSLPALRDVQTDVVIGHGTPG